MDSSVNARRAQRQKAARRRHLTVALIIFLIIALITLAIMCFTIFFPIKRISVSGSNIYSKSQIIKASKLTTDDNLLVVSEDEIENRVRKALPYVDSLKLKRVLPDAVIITVTDAEEHCYFKTENGYFILSEHGYILKRQTEAPQNTFEIVTGGINGKLGEKAVYQKENEEQLVNDLISMLEKEEINIDMIDVSNSFQISLSVENRFTVTLGNSEYLNEKIAHLSSMIENIPDRSGRINLSMWTPKNSQGSFIEESK